MKFWQLLFSTFLIFGFTYQQLNDNVHIDGYSFQATYSEVLEQPKNVTYEVRPYIEKKYERCDCFFSPSELHTSNNKDYYDNVWDRGHLAPARAFADDSLLERSTYSFGNIALQHQDLNRYAWKRLEECERNLANWYNTVVNVTVVLEFNDLQNKVEGGATIPSGFTKYIRIPKYNYDKSYYVKNEKYENVDFLLHNLGCSKKL